LTAGPRPADDAAVRRGSFLTAALCLFVAPVSAEAIESGDGTSANAGPTVGETARVQYEGWVGGFPAKGTAGDAACRATSTP
jgi:hypothetical protein